MTVLVKQSLAFLISKLAANSIQNRDESLIVNQSLFFKVNKFESSVRTNAFILLNLSSLAYSLVNSNFQLKYSLVAYCIFEKAETVDEQVHEKLLSFEGDACIHIFRELSELLMSKGISVIGPVPKSIFNISLGFICFFGQTSHVRMLLAFQASQEGGDGDPSVLVELLEGMVNGGQSLLRNVIADIINKLAIGDASGCGEVILDGPNFLRGEEDSACIKQQIEGMVGQGALVAGVVFGDLGVERDEVVVLLAEELEFEFVIDLRERIHPVHLEVIIFIEQTTPQTYLGMIQSITAKGLKMDGLLIKLLLEIVFWDPWNLFGVDERRSPLWQICGLGWLPIEIIIIQLL